VRARLQQLRMAYGIARQRQPRMPVYLGLALLLPVVLGVVLGILVGPLLLWVPSGLSVGFLTSTIIFGRTIQAAQFDALEGRPGAAAAVLDQLRGQWFVTPVVAANRKQDMVHRAIGRCGIVLVAEGSSTSRAKALLAQERTRAERVSGDTPVITFLVGDGEGDTISLDKLQSRMTRLSSELSKTEVPKLARKMAGLDKGNLSIPKGYIPPGGRQR
jgi:hypothetical protein